MRFFMVIMTTLACVTMGALLWAQSTPPPFPKFTPPVVPSAPVAPDVPPAAPVVPAKPTDGATADAALLEATNSKFNAFIEFMNSTLRVSDSLGRYKSWVNMRTGPTGRERLIYGLYGVFDVSKERAAAEAAIMAKPSLPDLDDAMRAYIAADDVLAPILNKANGYYEREDYKIDHMAEGKALHPQIVANGIAFDAARRHLESVMRVQKYAFDKIRLATIEQREGRRMRWHITNVMMYAKRTLDTLQDVAPKDANAKGAAKPGSVDMAAFNVDMAAYGEAVKGLDDFAAAHPGSFSAFESFPASMLGRLREVQGRLARTHGDLQRAAGLDMTFIVSDYNTMVTTADTALTFIK